MTRVNIVTKTDIKEYPLLSRGKVRDIYAIDDYTLLLVTTDRMSAFDVIMSEPIPYKGIVLNQTTLFWMDKFKNLVANHLIAHEVVDFPKKLQAHKNDLEGRSVLVRRARPLPVECIVRGYISGSGWADYLATGQVCGHPLPPGLSESAKLAEPLFTPSTKAELGQHDENLSTDQAVEMLGKELFEKVRDVSLSLFEKAGSYASSRGIIIADSKFEFGIIEDKLLLIDEVLTPDSSRFWPKAGYRPGKGQPSFDKQYLRDWLLAQDWNKAPPPPALPREVIDNTGKKYREAYTLLTGQELAF